MKLKEHNVQPLSLDDVVRRIQPRRRIIGISAILLPFNTRGQIDEKSFAEQLRRCVAAGLTPAVNMDTGYVNLLSRDERARVLEIARDIVDGRSFVAGTFIEGQEGSPAALYLREIEQIRNAGGTPILFQCSAMKAMTDADLLELYRQAASGAPEIYAFELGEMFAPFGKIFSIDFFERLLEIPGITGAKHSSLSRELEWERLEVRDRVRPDFKLFTGNDLAIDMVTYGSDYLLGLSAFYPEAFALRDRMWVSGDAQFYTLNDLLQYLGMFAFRPPVPAYKHTAAQFLKLRDVIAENLPHPNGHRRPESDVDVLQDILRRIDALMENSAA